jgi:secretion/DNA translocation related TadE-like protein
VVTSPGMRRPAEDGSGSVLAVAIAAVVFLLLGLLVPLYRGLEEKVALAGAADAAALAAADAAAGAVAGPACAAAARVVAANRGRLTLCRVQQQTVTVVVSGALLGLPITASARAGPPPQEDRHGIRLQRSD